MGEGITGIILQDRFITQRKGEAAIINSLRIRKYRPIMPMTLEILLCTQGVVLDFREEQAQLLPSSEPKRGVMERHYRQVM